MRAEDFFLMGWLDRPFRRKPYPDMTYEGAINTAAIMLWNMDTPEADEVADQLIRVLDRMAIECSSFPGRSIQNVSEFGELWRGKVSTLLAWFQKSGGTA